MPGQRLAIQQAESCTVSISFAVNGKAHYGTTTEDPNYGPITLNNPNSVTLTFVERYGPDPRLGMLLSTVTRQAPASAHIAFGSAQCTV